MASLYDPQPLHISRTESQPNRIPSLILDDPEAPRLEVLRQLREEGVRLGASTFYRLHGAEREAPPASLMVRFEGVAGEFARVDLGQADVRLLDGRTKRVHFAAYRLKYSRWVSMVPRHP